MTRHLTDPTRAANCDACPLKTHWEKKGLWRPCPSEINGTDTIVVGDAPSKQDTDAAQPWVDMHAADALDALQQAGLKRHNVSWTYAVACRWPKDRSKEFLAVLAKRNQYRKRKGEPPHPTPQQCCAPRLRQDLTGHANVITMGEVAAKAVLPGAPSFMDVRGGPTEVDGRKVLPTFHPRQLFVQPKFKPVFVKDLKKAQRYFQDKLGWKGWPIIWNPSALQLLGLYHAWLERGDPVYWDLETDAIESLTAKIRCIGIGNRHGLAMIHVLSRDGETRPYHPEGETQIVRGLEAVLTDKRLTKVGHNSGYYDRIVCEQQWGFTPTPQIDTILLHKLAESEYPHGLGYVGSVYTDVPAWKAEHTATEAKTDKELGTYCATDVQVTQQILKPLVKQVEARGQRHLYKHDATLQDMCVGMKRMGLRVDEDKRWAHEIKQTDLATKWMDVAHDVIPEINLNSHDQVRELLFRKWVLPPQQFNPSGDPSTNAASLIALLSSPILDDHQRVFIEALRKYRKATKLLTTYILKFAPEAGVVRGGYVHPDYNVGGTVTGRFSSGFQQMPFEMRDMFIPPEGCVFVEADYDQLELRLATAITQAAYYLEAFNRREVDPHNLTGALMFGDSFWRLDGAPEDKFFKGEGTFKKARDAAKTLCFLSLYGGGAPMAHEKMVSTENKQGDLIYQHYSLAEVRALHRRWLRNVPEFKEWWERCLATWRKRGYISEPILQRRRYFHEEDYNAIPNFQVQAGGFAIVARGMKRAVKAIPWDFEKGEGLCGQLHDAVLFSVREDKAERAKQEVIECLTTEALGMDFTVDAHIGKHWSEK
jgi:DNA polymerase-1